MYIYIYIYTYVSLSLSLSLYIYIYVHTHIQETFDILIQSHCGDSKGNLTKDHPPME